MDDKPEIIFSLKLGLERHGFQVDTFNNPVLGASQTQDCYKPSLYDLLLPDIKITHDYGRV